LVNRVLSKSRKEKLLEEVEEMPALEVDAGMSKEVENISFGVFSPLEGFLCREDYLSVLHTKRLASDVPWTIPVVLDVRDAGGIREGDEVILTHQGAPLAVLDVEEKYGFDRREHAEAVYGTNDSGHPGVARTYEMGDLLLGGRVSLIRETGSPYYRYALKPEETRRVFREKGWKTIVGFQTRNVPHLGHEYVQKTALTFTDGLFINPVVGRKKKGDFKDDVILECYQALIDSYYPKDRVLLGVLQTEMRYAGPREAVFHAIVRKNFGCTHFIVGRDHAGVGSYYHPFAAHEIFSEFPDLGITPMFFRSFYYCKKCASITNDKVCPHSETQERLDFSGTKMRRLIEAGKKPPADSMREEVAEVILRYENPFVE